jgi:hypothetical protein
VTSTGPKLADLVGDLNADGKVRAAALKALAKMQVDEFEDALVVAKADFDPDVRRASVIVYSMSSSGMGSDSLNAPDGWCSGSGMSPNPRLWFSAMPVALTTSNTTVSRMPSQRCE